MQRTKSADAVAQWYLALHESGRKLKINPNLNMEFLKSHVDILDASTLFTVGRNLNIGKSPGWSLAVKHIETLRAIIKSMGQTLNHNDFHWSNLALSRTQEPAQRAVVFDYHLLGIGLRYNDCRYVTAILGKEAAAAFWERYGPVDDRERLLAEPIEVLYLITLAAWRDRLPTWALESLIKVRSGVLERALREALEIV